MDTAPAALCKQCAKTSGVNAPASSRVSVSPTRHEEEEWRVDRARNECERRAYCFAVVAFCAMTNIANLFDRDYFFVPFAISAAVAFVPGGEIANPGGEWAPEASSGLEVAGVNGET